ncbi:MAG: hypothetical protein ACU843_15525 [Gammaproteobacteria bacterium]
MKQPMERSGAASEDAIPIAESVLRQPEKLVGWPEYDLKERTIPIKRKTKPYFRHVICRPPSFGIYDFHGFDVPKCKTTRCERGGAFAPLGNPFDSKNSRPKNPSVIDF